MHTRELNIAGFAGRKQTAIPESAFSVWQGHFNARQKIGFTMCKKCLQNIDLEDLFVLLNGLSRHVIIIKVEIMVLGQSNCLVFCL